MKDMNITGNAIENLLMSYADHKAQVRLFMEDENINAGELEENSEFMYHKGFCECAERYIINPSGYSDLINTTRDIPNLQLIDIWIDCDTDQLQLRSKKRSTADNWQANRNTWKQRI